MNCYVGNILLYLGAVSNLRLIAINLTTIRRYERSNQHTMRTNLRFAWWTHHMWMGTGNGYNKTTLRSIWLATCLRFTRAWYRRSKYCLTAKQSVAKYIVFFSERIVSKRVFLDFFFRIYVQQFLGSNSVISGMENAFFPSEKKWLEWSRCLWLVHC